MSIAGVIFSVGYWYFETIFRTGRAPLELGPWSPIVVIGVGVAALIVGLLGRDSRAGDPQVPSTQGDVR